MPSHAPGRGDYPGVRTRRASGKGREKPLRARSRTPPLFHPMRHSASLSSTLTSRKSIYFPLLVAMAKSLFDDLNSVPSPRSSSYSDRSRDETSSRGAPLLVFDKPDPAVRVVAVGLEEDVSPTDDGLPYLAYSSYWRRSSVSGITATTGKEKGSLCSRLTRTLDRATRWMVDRFGPGGIRGPWDRESYWG